MTDITTYEQLQTAAEQFAQTLRADDVVGLVGELGAGKTTFVKEVANSLGIRDDVISPTFVYHQMYRLPTPVRGIERLHHLDLYRLSTDADLDALGLDTDDSAGITLIEWIDHAPRLHACADRILSFTLHPDGHRTLTEDQS